MKLESDKNNKENYLKKIKQAAHDLNNILTSISASVTTLNQKIEPNKDVNKLLLNIENSTIRAAEIVDDLLAKDGSKTKIKRKIQINKLILDVTDSIKNTLNKKIELKINTANEVFKVRGNFSDLYRVVLNLLINAKEAIIDKGKIEISTYNSEYKDTKYVVISIKDTGAGIYKENIDSIFNDGFSTKDKSSESGLGLFIVKDIINDHNGFIEVESKPGKGTEFIIYLPRIIPLKKIISDNPEKTILIAEDETTILELLSDLLRSYNYNVISVVNGSEALSKINSVENIDLLIIDKKMPDLDGITCINKIRKTDKKMPIILMTGSQSITDIIDSELRIDGKIKKPYNFEEILDLVRSLIN